MPGTQSVLDGLNPAQKLAVASPASVLQVLAPPGSGKTKTLTARVAYLISERNYTPCNIIICTFTVKAAREMKERLRGLIGDGLESRLILGTFHSVARRFLVSYGQWIGIDKKFGVADTDDSKSIIQRIIKRNHHTVEPAVARARISGLKAQEISCEEYSNSLKKTDQQEFAMIYHEYEASLKAQNLLDYDDLLLRCADLLLRHPVCVSNVEAVLIDEFQDTNVVQFDLMRLFSQQRKCVTIVGDPDQSIYGFRSAEIRNLKRMRQQYPDTVVITLEENYRSSGSILLSALEVIEQDESRPAKKLLPTHCVGARPVMRKLPSAGAEGLWIVSEIKRFTTLTANLLRYSDVAILLRSANLSRTIESALGKAGLPYRMVGGRRFFDRMEIKVILDYLRVISQPDHNDALVRIINVPSRKIGEVTVKSLLDEAEAKEVSLWSIVEHAAKGNAKPKTKLSAQAMKGLESFVNVIITSQKKLAEENAESFSLIELLTHVLRKVSFEEHLKRSHPEDFESRWANVQELVAQATDMSAAITRGEDINGELLPEIDGFEQREATSVSDLLSTFLANVALSSEVQRTEENEAADSLTISTIHAAKGLEWPVVFIPGAYKGSIPHSRAEDTDEERRLLYVAMTRAQSLLYLSCPMKSSQGENTTLSPFLSTKPVTRLMALQGPSFNLSITQDMAHILRRDCPSVKQLEAARGLVGNIEDNLWPLNGDHVDAEDKRWVSGKAEHPNDHEVNVPKRRKLEREHSQSESSRQRRGIQAATTITTCTTLRSQGNFSISSTTIQRGFVSAGEHLTELEVLGRHKQHEDEGIAPGDGQKEPTSRVGRKLQSAARVDTQGSLTNYFTTVSAKESKLAVLPAADLEAEATCTPRFPPLQEISNRSVPPPSIDVSSKTHRPRMAPMHGRPRKTVEEEQTPSARFVLLSSSPPRYEESENTPSAARTEEQATAEDGVATKNDVRPASTFHATSVMHTLQKTASVRKTLGVRRSLNGWSVRMGQGARAEYAGRDAG